MSKKGIPILFSVVFLLYIVTPTIFMIVDEAVDVSILFSTSEEKEKGKHVDIDILFSMTQTNNFDLVFSFSERNLEYFDKKYTKPHINIISPPPELSNIIV
ncbi:MAG: hypothetical protein ACWIPJ_04575 [Polaribacter sp.]